MATREHFFTIFFICFENGRGKNQSMSSRKRPRRVEGKLLRQPTLPNQNQNKKIQENSEGFEKALEFFNFQVFKGEKRSTKRLSRT